MSTLLGFWDLGLGHRTKVKGFSGNDRDVKRTLRAIIHIRSGDTDARKEILEVAGWMEEELHDTWNVSRSQYNILLSLSAIIKQCFLFYVGMSKTYNWSSNVPNCDAPKNE
jgi:hypothetical protein